MPLVYELLASACPAVRPSTAPLTFANSAPVSDDLTAGNTAELVDFFNRNALRSDLAGRSAGGLYGIVTGLALTAGTGLAVNVATGWAFIDGMVARTATTATVTDGVRSYLWLNQAGGVVVLTTTAPPSGSCCFLGSVLAAGGAITTVDGSGVVTVNGFPYRKTADTGQPGDTPPATCRFLSETANAVYLWTGTAWVMAGGAGGGGGGPAPSDTVAALDGTSAAGASALYSRGDHRHQDANRPTTGEKAALAGSSGAPSGSNKYVTDADSRNTNARTPTAHAATHLPAGSDPITTAAPVDIGTANAAGTAQSLSKSDHVHKGLTEVAQGGTTVGRRRKVNITGGATVTDDAGNDQVTIDVNAGGGGGVASDTVVALDGTGVAGASSTYSRGDHRHADTNRPTDNQKAALAGTSGAASVTNKYVTDADPRNSDARVPTAHASTHLPNGSDPITTASAVGLGTANAAGTANSLARSDHTHKRESAVSANGTPVGTRGSVNFTGSVTVTDNPGNDRVDVDVTGGGAGTPSGTVAALDGTGAAGSSSNYSRGDHRHADVNRPTDNEKAALGGTVGTPSATNKYVTDADARNTNARTPTAHASTHLPNGSDPLTTAAAAGLANANGAGTANSFSRSDHQHKRDLRVANTGTDVGTRNRLNVAGVGYTLADDPGNDQVTLNLAPGWTRDPTNGLIYPSTITDHVGIGSSSPTNHMLRVLRTGTTGVGANGRSGIHVDSIIGPGDIDAGGGPDVGAIESLTTYTNTTAGASDLVHTGHDSRIVYGDATHPASGTAQNFTATCDIVNSASQNNELSPFFAWARLRGMNPGSIWMMDLSAHGSINSQPGLLLGPVSLVNNYFNGSASRAETAGLVVVTSPGQGAGRETGHDVATTYPLDNGIIIAGRSSSVDGRGYKVGLRIGGVNASPWFPSDAGASKIGVGIQIQDLAEKAIQILGTNTGIHWGTDADTGRASLGWPGSNFVQVNDRLRVRPTLNVINDPCVEVGNPGVANQANALKVVNGSGDISLWVAGSANDFVTGSVAGDVGLRVAAGKVFRWVVGSAEAARLTASGLALFGRHFELDEIAAPAFPTAGHDRLYAGTDGHPHWRNSALQDFDLTAGTGAGVTIQDEGTALTQRMVVDFVGAGVTAIDDAPGGRTVVTIPGTAASEAAGTVAYDPPSLAHGQLDSFDVTLAGAVLNDVVGIAFSQVLPAGMFFAVPQVIGTNTVRNTLMNWSGATQNIASGTLRLVARH